ncbi:protein FAM162B-like [Sphaerodactylus townsendi]|uniref:protein FAM162B-like n=1 Tax=Sphaerodactylus townsendi TaxID=933632 RepID=UPI002027627E|nr:protein FAM162B-like [Sphaerodactylus townsendi]
MFSKPEYQNERILGGITGGISASVHGGWACLSRRKKKPGSQGRHIFRSEKRPTEFDKKMLLWTGRFKKEEDIPPLLSVEVLKAAQNQMRIRICYIMMALTLLGCVAMVISGKQAAKREDTLLKINTEKKAKWRLERQLEQESAAGKTE